MSRQKQLCLWWINVQQYPWRSMPRCWKIHWNCLRMYPFMPRPKRLSMWNGSFVVPRGVWRPECGENEQWNECGSECGETKCCQGDHCDTDHQRCTTRVVYHRYKSRFRPESEIFQVQTQIWILSGPDQNQIWVWTGSGQNSDFRFKIENSKKSKN